MYNKIPTKINPTKTYAKITYAIAFDPKFFLLLRERRDTSLSQMQYATLEVGSNILAAEKIRSKYDRYRGKGRVETSTSDSSATHPQVDELTKLVIVFEWSPGEQKESACIPCWVRQGRTTVEQKG
jgi:hypothetical protein